MPRRYLDTGGKEDRIARAKASNSRERNIAKQYFNAGPSIGNLARAAYHWYNSVPILGGQNEDGRIYITGEAPTPGMRSPKKILSNLKQIRRLRGKPSYNTYDEAVLSSIKRQAKTKDARDKFLAEQYDYENTMRELDEKYYDDLYNATKETIESERWLTDEPYLMAEGAEQRVFDRINNNIWADKNVYKPNRFFTNDEYDLIKKAHPKELERLKDLSAEIWINSSGPSTGSYFPKGFTYDDWIRTRPQKANGGSIHIAPSKRGTFTAAATKHGMGVQEFAARVLRNKDDYSPSLIKKANFARNASKWNH